MDYSVWGALRESWRSSLVAVNNRAYEYMALGTARAHACRGRVLGTRDRARGLLLLFVGRGGGTARGPAAWLDGRVGCPGAQGSAIRLDSGRVGPRTPTRPPVVRAPTLPLPLLCCFCCCGLDAARGPTLGPGRARGVDGRGKMRLVELPVQAGRGRDERAAASFGRARRRQRQRGTRAWRRRTRRAGHGGGGPAAAAQGEPRRALGQDERPTSN